MRGSVPVSGMVPAGGTRAENGAPVRKSFWTTQFAALDDIPPSLGQDSIAIERLRAHMPRALGIAAAITFVIGLALLIGVAFGTRIFAFRGGAQGWSTAFALLIAPILVLAWPIATVIAGNFRQTVLEDRLVRALQHLTPFQPGFFSSWSSPLPGIVAIGDGRIYIHSAETEYRRLLLRSDHVLSAGVYTHTTRTASTRGVERDPVGFESWFTREGTRIIETETTYSEQTNYTLAIQFRCDNDPEIQWTTVGLGGDWQYAQNAQALLNEAGISPPTASPGC